MTPAPSSSPSSSSSTEPLSADRRGSERGTGSVFRRRVLLGLVAAAVITVDQSTKTWALHHAVVPDHLVGPVWFSLTFNSGSAFSLGRGVRPVVETVVVVLVVGLVLASQRVSRYAGSGVMVALGLLLGGALSNLADRVVRHHNGAVIDFVEIARFGGHDWWPVFNVADAAITVGAVALVAIGVFHRGRHGDAPRR